MRRTLLIAVTVLALVGPAATAASAQDEPRPGPPTQDIVPQPNSGEAPEDAGDRGGALQLLVVGAIVVALGGAVLHLVRQSQRARSQPS